MSAFKNSNRRKEHGQEFDFDGKIATPEVESYLAKDGPEGVNLETGWTSKTRFTGKYNDA